MCLQVCRRIFYVSDVSNDVTYGGVINNRRGPNEQHAKSVG